MRTSPRSIGSWLFADTRGSDVHLQAYQWVSRYAADEPVRVLDIGGRNINGTCRPLFPNADYTVLDLAPGPDVDIVADAADWTPDREYDLVLCVEVFEHAGSWPAICWTARRATQAGGRLVLTMAGPGRAPHSAVDGGPLRAGEHYRNVEPEELAEILQHGWTDVVIDQLGADVRATAVK